MPNSTYLPSTDRGLLGFASNMNAQLAIDPAAFGLSVQQQLDFQSHLSMYAGALNTLSNPYTTGKPYTHAKNFAKDQLLNGESGIRQLVNFIKGRPEITDDQRSALRLTIPKTERTPALPPTTRPVIVITNTVGRTGVVQTAR